MYTVNKSMGSYTRVYGIQYITFQQLRPYTHGLLMGHADVFDQKYIHVYIKDTFIVNTIFF